LIILSNYLEVRASAQARPDCLDSTYGCCWDLTAAQGPNGEGCRGKQRLRTDLPYAAFLTTGVSIRLIISAVKGLKF